MAKKVDKGNGNSFVARMKLEKETKNTIRFEEVYDEKKEAATIRTIYVPKHLAGESKELKVTVEML